MSPGSTGAIRPEDALGAAILDLLLLQPYDAEP